MDVAVVTADPGRPLTVLPFSSARPSRRQPCWSCCTSYTTSWPSKQVSSPQPCSVPQPWSAPVSLAKTAYHCQASVSYPPLKLIVPSIVGVQYRAGSPFSFKALGPPTHGPLSRYKILSPPLLLRGPVLVGREQALEDPGPEALVPVSLFVGRPRWSVAACSRAAPLYISSELPSCIPPPLCRPGPQPLLPSRQGLKFTDAERK